MLHARGLLVALLAAVAVACGDAASKPSESFGERRQLIVGGLVDPTHGSVVALLRAAADPLPICTGTLVATEPAKRIGWVITTGPCATAAVARMADDTRKEPCRDFDVAQREFVTVVGEPTGEVAVLTVRGVLADTPFTPLLPRADDRLKAGAAFVQVGYGTTRSPLLGPDDGNSTRRSLVRTIKSLSESAIVTNYAAGGACLRDEGAPALWLHEGRETVAGLHWSQNGDCTRTATAMRLSGVEAKLRSIIEDQRGALMATPSPPSESAPDAATPAAAPSPPASVDDNNDDTQEKTTSVSARLDAGCSVAAPTPWPRLPWSALLALLLRSRSRRRG